jgi:hypothetical protein
MALKIKCHCGCEYEMHTHYPSIEDLRCEEIASYWVESVKKCSRDPMVKSLTENPSS